MWSYANFLGSLVDEQYAGLPSKFPLVSPRSCIGPSSLVPLSIGCTTLLMASRPCPEAQGTCYLLSNPISQPGVIGS